ncbi:MAG: hypothetical protein JXX28_17615 [Deltaproteobacteria bacterium]|nr:hypothetical protein [Deltaproteobacteria bacterium]
MITLLSLGATALVASLACLACWVTLASEEALARALRVSIRRLDALQLEQVTSGEEHHRVGEIFGQLGAGFPAVSRAWRDLSATIVVEEGRPRTTARPGDVLDREAMVARQIKSRRYIPSPRTLVGAPTNLLRLGLVLTLLLMVWVVLGQSPADSLQGWYGLVARLGVEGWATPLPLLAGGLAGTITHSVQEVSARRLDDVLAQFVAWFETHYRRLSTEELLTKVIEQQREIIALLGARLGAE